MVLPWAVGNRDCRQPAGTGCRRRPRLGVRLPDHHPGPSDIALVIEVADSSLARDRDIKGPAYAAAGLPVYWIVNLIERQVEVYTAPSGPSADPAYGQRQGVGIGGSV